MSQSGVSPTSSARAVDNYLREMNIIYFRGSQKFRQKDQDPLTGDGNPAEE
ncbi:hypothetical protein Bpfe_004929, partial [Biomphalaria pfeifferi]